MTTPAAKHERIPLELRQLDQWVCWKEIKGRKVPFNPSTGRFADPTDPGEWSDFETARKAAKDYRLDGVGFAFTADDPFCGIDLDGCRNPATGEIAGWAQRDIRRFASYTEISPSGKGVKIFVRGKKPAWAGCKKELDEQPVSDKQPAVEIYDRGRYFTVTGEWLEDTPETVNDAQEATDSLCAELFPRKPQRTNGTPTPGPPPSDDKARAIKRYRGWLAKFPPAIEGQNGSGTCFRACCMGVIYYGLSKAEARPLLDEWNQTCQPPWSDAELDHKLEGAWAKRDEDPSRIGCRLREPQNGRPGGRGYTNGTTNGHHATESTDAMDDGNNTENVTTDDNTTDTVQDNTDTGTVTENDIISINNAQKEGSKGQIHPLTDLGNSWRLRDGYGEDLRYNFPEKKWYRYDRRFAVDDRGAAQECAKKSVESIGAEAERVLTPEWQKASRVKPEKAEQLAKALSQWAKSSQSKNHITAALDLARSELPITPDEMDRDPWLFNVENCTINLRTGQPQPHRREDCITKMAPVKYDPDAKCPTFLRFLDDIMLGNQGMIAFLQRLFGYALTGLQTEHVLPILFGDGANGKTTLIQSLFGVMGSGYSGPTPPKLLLAKHREDHPTIRADLFGKRFLCCVESDEGDKIDEGLIKSLTGGDRQKARFCKADYFEFTPTWLMALCTNHRPEVCGTDAAIWRRLLLIPFDYTVPEDKRDRDLPEKLIAEAPGILNCLIAGCLAWQKGGLQEPEEVLLATRDYRKEEDTISAWIKYACVTGSKALRVKGGQAHKAYVQWCENSNIEPKGLKTFGGYMKRQFEHKHSGGSTYIGVGLKADQEMEAEF